MFRVTNNSLYMSVGSESDSDNIGTCQVSQIAMT